jgi:hypothetical protein
MNQLTGIDLLAMFRDELELCAVKPGEHLVVLADPGDGA